MRVKEVQKEGQSNDNCEIQVQVTEWTGVPFIQLRISKIKQSSSMGHYKEIS